MRNRGKPNKKKAKRASFIQTLLSATEWNRVSALSVKAVAGLTAGWESHPAPKTLVIIF